MSQINVGKHNPYKLVITQTIEASKDLVKTDS